MQVPRLKSQALNVLPIVSTSTSGNCLANLALFTAVGQLAPASISARALVGAWKMEALFGVDVLAALGDLEIAKPV